MNEIFDFFQNMKWSDIGTFITAVAGATVTVGGAFMSVISFWDKRAKQRSDEKHAQEMERENLKNENTTAQIDAIKVLNEDQGKKLEEHGKLLAAHTAGMNELKQSLDTNIETITKQYREVYTGSALIYGENKKMKIAVTKLQEDFGKVQVLQDQFGELKGLREKLNEALTKIR